MKTILIIDDQADNLVSIKALLQNYISECNILTAMSGKEGIESARKNQPDTILLDIIMPEMDGFDTCERLKKDKQTQHIPIILITAIRTDIKSRVKGLEMGADAFLSKPIDATELSAQVNVMLRIKEAEDKLRKEKTDLDKLVTEKIKEVRYQSTVLENISDPIISLDMNYKIKSWNEGAEKLYGWKEEEVLGKAFKDILLAEYSHGSREESINTLNTTGYFKDEVIHYKKDGSRLIISGSVSFIHDDHGNRTGIVSVNHDITENKLAEKKLRDTQESLKNTFDISPGLICVADASTGFFISCNQAVKSILGFSITEFLSKPFIEFIHPDDKQKTVDEITKQLKGNSVAHFENRYQCKNKSFKWLAWQATKADKDGLVHAVATDITKRKQEEKELLKNQYFLSKAQEIGNIGTWELDILKNQLIWTKENYKIFGVQVGTEMTYELFLNCVHPEDREYVNKKWSDALNNKPYDIEHRLLVKDKVKWVREKADLTFDEKGNAVKAIGITHDITDRKIAEEKAKESEQLRMKLLDNLPVVTLILKHHSREIVACNKAALDMGAVVGKTCYESLTQCEHSCPFCLAPKLWETNESQITEAAYIGKHWEGRWIPFTDELYIHYIYDISERKRSEKIQKAIYNISNAVILSNDLEDLALMIKNELHELLDTQNFFIALYDDKTKMIDFPFFINDKDKIEPYKIGKSLTSYVITSGKTLFANVSKKKQLVKEGKLIYKGSLSKIWLGVPLKVKEKIMGVISVQSYTDENAYDESDVEILEFIADQISISLERKKAELDLKKALQKATESDRLKSAFLTTMSHELRTPLNAIIGFSGIIDKNSTIDDIVKFNETINSSGKHLLNIVEELFDITLIETGEMKIKKEPFDLYSLLYDVEEIIKLEQISNKKTHLKIKLVVPSKETGLIINSDPSKFKQILLNLLKNAIKFTDEGQVNFGFEIIKQKEKFLLEFFIQDTGIGIAADKFELIFVAFRQVDESHTRLHGGTGIGLSISKRLVELIGGTIRVESTEGKGSTFYFTIPYEEKLNADYSVDSDIEIQTASEITKSHRIKNKNILIVEDDEASYEFLKTVLVKSGFTLLWAKNGEEAIHLCKEKSEIDLVLMDIDMPIMNGYEATKVIKKFRPKLPIIAQTAYAIIGDREKSIEAGCSDYISKPINRNMLLEKVKAQLSNTKTKN